MKKTKYKINQFGHIRCQEALHMLRSALILRRQHGLATYTLFVDLVKAFNMVNHSLLIKVLFKHGIPPTMCRTIAKLYENCKVQLKAGKSMCEIDYKTGIQQGDNMAPILFLFIMQSVMETLDKDLPANNSKPEFRYFPNDKGCLTGQRTKSAGTSFNVFSLLFIDDGALFQSQDEMEKAAQTIHDHFKRFGLQMHVGSKETNSKMRPCISPPP